MKKHGLISAVMASTVLLGTVSSANAEPVYRYTGDSEYATVTSNGFAKRVYLTVNRVKVNSSATTGITHTTRLFYSVYDAGNYQYWSGEIANSDFSGSVSGKMTLNTNTCDYNPTPSCGVVSMTWTNNGDNSTQTSGVTHSETAYYTMHRSGTTKFAEADVSGTVNGVSVNLSDTVGSLFGYGRMGSDRSTTVRITNK